MTQAIDKADFDFRKDPMEISEDPLQDLQTRLAALQNALAHALVADRKAQEEYDQFFEGCRVRRVHAAEAVAIALKRVSDLHAQFTIDYDKARAEFEKRDTSKDFISSTKKKIQSSAAMDDIKKAADEEIARLGGELQTRQEKEIALTLKLKYVRTLLI
jgi:hypothetical protein